MTKDREIAMLREALLKASRHAGAGLVDTVSSEFLATAADEIVAVLDAKDAKLRRCLGAAKEAFDESGYCFICGQHEHYKCRLGDS